LVLPTDPEKSLLQDEFVPPCDAQAVPIAGVLDPNLLIAAKQLLRAEDAGRLHLRPFSQDCLVSIFAFGHRFSFPLMIFFPNLLTPSSSAVGWCRILLLRLSIISNRC
jgi:hypothetical protein